MGRSPCCSKEGLNKGAWTALEDKILTAYIKANGEGKWRNLPKRAGLKRCGKSCRLRWLNYLRPDIKRGNISHDEEELIIRLHNLLGNRWSLIAGRLPGRTDNEIKNYWNTTLGKKAKAQSSSETTPPCKSKSRHKKPSNSPKSDEETKIQVIRTKATRCSGNVLVPSQPPPPPVEVNLAPLNSSGFQDYQPYLRNHDQEMASTEVFDEMGGSDFLNSELIDNIDQLAPHLQQTSNGESHEENNDDINYKNLGLDPMQPSLEFDEEMFKDWTTNSCLDYNAAMNLDSFAFLLDPDEWP